MELNLPKVHGSTISRDGKELVSPQFILKPEVFAIQIGATVQMAAYLRTEAGEVKLIQGVSFSSNNTAVLTVSATGLATMIASGVAVVEAVWQNMVAYANITVLTGNCSTTQVAYEVLIDSSDSMSSIFNNVYASKFEAARQIASQFIANMNAVKDLIGLMTFSTVASEVKPIGQDSIYGGLYGMTLTRALTTLLPSLQSALDSINAQNPQRRVIVIISDGDNIPRMTVSEVQSLIGKMAAFKKGGGVVIVCGIRAEGKSFNLLQQIASAGFFINAYGDGDTVVSSTATALAGLLGFFCGGSSAVVPGAQLPDPNPIIDLTEKKVAPKYASTKTCCDAPPCPVGKTNTSGVVCKSATAFSDLSQADADEKALQKAMAAVYSALICA